MSKYLLLFIFFISGVTSFAQQTDSIFAVRKGPNLAIRHVLKPGESIAMLAYRFYTAVDKIESMSEVDGRKKLAPGTVLLIPLTSENFLAAREAVGIENHEQVFYKVKEKDNIPLICIYLGIKKPDLILWNSLHGNTITEGQPLFVGWVKMIPQDSINIANGVAYPSHRRTAIVETTDTVKHAFGGLDSLYNVQTSNGRNTITEKGTAVFFEKTGKNNIYYAFHNTTPRGAIIKVTNPGTGKYIYAKVLGPIPDTKLYANSIIGICNAAKEMLGVTEEKAWCELSYSPN